jgi:hypothetical protein
MKQVFHAKAAGGIGRGLEPEPFMERYEFDATKMKLFPVAEDAARAVPYATRIDRLASERAAHRVRAVLDDTDAWSNAKELRRALDLRHERDFADLQLMVALQEELDWLCYALYGLDDGGDLVPPDAPPDVVEPLPPTALPWCLAFAERDAANRAALASGEEPDELPSVWFERHRWEPLTEPPSTLSPATRARIAARRRRTRETPALALIETANFKRRWYRPDYLAEEREALAAWLADRIEQVMQGRSHPATLEQVTAAVQDDPRVLAVCECLSARRDFSLAALLAECLAADAVPNHRYHVYKPTGLEKRALWARTWEDQRREDSGEPVTPQVPPAYGTGDFLKPDYWRLRGKLDVPKERFIAFTEVPGRAAADNLYGWAGWTPVQRVKAMLTLDEQLEDSGVPLADRIALLDSAWRLLPDLAREDPAAAGRLKAELQSIVGLDGPSKEMLEDWRQRFPPPGARSNRTKTKPK